MSWLPSFILVTCLAFSDLVPETSISQSWQVIGMTLLLCLLPSAVALISPRAKSRHWPRSPIAALCVWSVMVPVVCFVVRWPILIRVNWKCAEIPLGDELLIAAPLVASLVSWQLILRIPQRRLLRPHAWTEALREISIWTRWQAALAWLPIAALYLARDMIALSVPPPWQTMASVIGLCLFFGGLLYAYPCLFNLILETSRLADPSLEVQLSDNEKAFGLPTTPIRVCHTDMRMANAFVVGMFPTSRRILFTDSLLRDFSPSEIAAIHRHELGHLVFRHLSMRLFCMVCPILALTIVGMRIPPEQWTTTLAAQGYEPWFVLGVLLPAATIGYFLGVLTWLIRNAELEADILACSAPTGQISLDRASDYQNALRKMAVWTPERYQRSSLTHPSIETRLLWTASVARNPQLAHEFRRKFRIRRYLLTVLLVASLLTAALA